MLPKRAKQKIKCLETGLWDFPLYSCGTNDVAPKPIAFIFGGIAALRETAPWHVAIYRYDPQASNFGFICGGSMIGPRLVATAGHCFVNEAAVNQYKVVIGSLKSNYDTKKGQHFNIVHFEIAEG